MKRLAVLGLAVGLLGASLAAWGCRPAPRPMNIVFVVADTTRADHLGSYGYSRDTTPNIDKLARTSVVFEQAYSHSPWTMPSVASMLTSLPPREHGIVTWEQPLSREFLTLPEHLREHSFRTAAFVSHVIFEPRYGFDQGFTSYDDSVLSKGDPANVSTSKEISDLAIEWLETTDDRPFFVWIHYFDPHEGYMHHDSHHFGYEGIDYYDSEIAFMDHHIGRVLDTLENRGLMDSTIVVFVGDHGEEFRDHGGTAHSRTLYDELVRIPLVFYVPGFEAQRVRHVVAESDLAPSLCRLTNVPVPEEFSGRAFDFDRSGFRVEQGRTVVMETFRRAEMVGVRFDRWKFIHDLQTETFELFDLDADPAELQNVIDDHRDVADFLAETIADHYRKGRRAVEKGVLPDPLREQLESLGYVQ